MQQNQSEILDLHDSIQGCFKYLDERIYKVVSHQPISHTVIVERDNQQLIQENQQLIQQMKHMQLEHDRVCSKLYSLQKKLQEANSKYEMCQLEVTAQAEILKRHKLAMAQSRITHTEELNIYKPLKSHIRSNESPFGLFLQTILYQRKADKQMDLGHLLNSIERYYRPMKRKVPAISTDQGRLPTIRTRVERINYKLNSALRINKTFDIKQQSAQDREARSLSFY